MSVIPIPFGALYAEIIAAAGWLYVFKIVFPASLFVYTTKNQVDDGVTQPLKKGFINRINPLTLGVAQLLPPAKVVPPWRHHFSLCNGSQLNCNIAGGGLASNRAIIF